MKLLFTLLFFCTYSSIYGQTAPQNYLILNANGKLHTYQVGDEIIFKTNQHKGWIDEIITNIENDGFKVYLTTTKGTKEEHILIADVTEISVTDWKKPVEKNYGSTNYIDPYRNPFSHDKRTGEYYNVYVTKEDILYELGKLITNVKSSPIQGLHNNQGKPMRIKLDTEKAYLIITDKKIEYEN